MISHTYRLDTRAPTLPWFFSSQSGAMQHGEFVRQSRTLKNFPIAPVDLNLPTAAFGSLCDYWQMEYGGSHESVRLNKSPLNNKIVGFLHFFCMSDVK